ncbi:MAG: caspase family protein [Alphaproteobacteria bacterium]|nr:caspase family protein [Alphaproteobacteria bacterium]
MKRIIVAAVAVPLMLVAVGGCQTARYTEPVQATRLDAGGRAETTSNVLANAGEWRNSGVIVEVGQRYRIRAEGRWQAAPTCAPTGPEGDGMYGLLCPAWDIGRVLTGHAHQKLIGKVGQAGTPFPIGTYRELTADREGTLFLSMNEQLSGVADNGGSLTVRVSLDAPSAPAVARAPRPTTIAAPSPQTAKPTSRFPTALVSATFPSGPVRPDDIAVIIGNANYSRAKDIPDVTPAHADAASFKRYAMTALGVREGNIIDIRDATQGDMVAVFGSERSHKGRLFNWVLAGKSRVHVYYAGHGAPAGADGTPYLVPVDANATTIELNGYPLDLLYRNLSKVPAQSISVVLEACFSGASQAGSVIPRASGIYVRPKVQTVPGNITVIAAADASQIASWEQDSSHGLFTKYYLLGLAGEADKTPYGNADGNVIHSELDTYLNDTLTYFARRYYGRDQKARIVVGSGG